jgi:hypothetical protein
MSVSRNDAFEAIVAEVTTALKLDSNTGGLLCVFDGFFMYEQDGQGCLSVVAPAVEEPSTFWIAVCNDTTTDWRYLVESPDGIRKALQAAVHTTPVAPAVSVSNGTLCDFQWLPPWTEYMNARPLQADWRTSTTWPLLFDMVFSGGVIGALPDRFTLDQESGWAQGGSQHKQRTSTVAAYAVAGPGVLRVDEHDVPFGDGQSTWTVMVVSHRQILCESESVQDARVRVGLAHDAALAAVHGDDLSALQRPQFTTVPTPSPSRRAATADVVISGFKPSHVQAVATAAGEVGCNSPRVRRASAATQGAPGRLVQATS